MVPKIQLVTLTSSWAAYANNFRAMEYRSKLIAACRFIYQTCRAFKIRNPHYEILFAPVLQDRDFQDLRQPKIIFLLFIVHLPFYLILWQKYLYILFISAPELFDAKRK